MRNSPINYIRQQRERQQRQQSSSPYAIRSRQSPERGQISSYSPERNLSNFAEGEYWRQRSKQLQVQLVAVNEELLFQVRKNQNVEDLEGKIELLLAQNTHFVDENQNLIRLVQQKNSEIEMWKRKFDSQYTHSNYAEAEKKKIFDHLNIKDQEHQVQIDKLLIQISRLQDQAAEMENLKQIEISQLKNKYENQAINQIQNLKRSQYGNNELQELNIRKLKDEIEEKNFQIENLRRQAKLQNQRLNGEISFLKNEVKKVQHQKEHQIDLIRTENENTKNNLLRTYRKNQEQIKNLHQTKVKRLVYEIEEKKNQLEDKHGKLKKGGKENETQLNRMVQQKSKMRVELKENDNRNRNAIMELTKYYQKQGEIQRQTAQKRQKNLSSFYEEDITSLKEVIKAKEKQIQRLLDLNAFLKQNEEQRLEDIRGNNNQLKKKMQEMVKHYEREVQLMKIKISQLYEADLQSLKSNMRNSYAAHGRQNENLRAMLKEVREKLAQEVQDRLDLRKDYENRLNEYKVKYEREHQQLHDLITMHEKQLQNQTSKASLTHIEHNDKMQKQHLSFKELANEKRRLEAQIENKNKQIQSLNEQIQKMLGYHNRQVRKLEEEVTKLKNEHLDWVQRQNKENQIWSNDKTDFKDKINSLQQTLEDNKNRNKQKEETYLKQIQDLKLMLAGLRGELEEYESKVGQLHSKNKVEVENIEKTHLETQSIMNEQKEKHFNISKKQRELLNEQYIRNRGQLQKQVDEIKQENQLLRDNYEQSKIREEQLKTQISNLLDSVNQRSKLEEHVINIGLSNNYFKNVSEIFKKNIDL